MKISIITICFNAEREIERTIRSVLEQSYTDYEYIIVDGLSSDHTIQVANRILADYRNKNVRIISERDNGIYDAMNKGIMLANGEWINMMNAGDMFANKDVLKNVFANNITDNVSFLYSDLYKATSYGRIFRVNMHCSEHERCIVHQSVIYRKSLHYQYGFYIVTPQIIISDYLFFLQVPTHEIKKVDTVIAVYEGNGVSEQGNWCKQQILCADVVFRNRSFWTIYKDFIWWKIKTTLPKRIREKIRLYQAEVYGKNTKTYL